MAIRLPFHLGSLAGIEPGQYTLVNGREFVCCPSCGGGYELPLTHRVTPDGRVLPAVKCPTVTCPFLEWVELEPLI